MEEVIGGTPLVRADRPFGEWNRFRIRQVGDRTWVWLNGKLVVDGAVMENYWARGRPLPARGPIMLQTHGGEIRWRNLFVRALGAEEGRRILAAAEAETRDRLSRALTLHASFDRGLDADFARGDAACYVARGKDLATDRPILFICKTGQRSAVAAEFAASLGLTDLYNVEGGIVAWARAGYEVEPGS